MFSLVVIFLILLCCSAFFSGSETALFSLSGVQLHRFRKLHTSSTAKLVESLKKPRKMLITILLGNEFVNVCISIVGAAIISRLMKGGIEAQTIAAVVIITPIILIGGEIIPKNISLRYARHIAPVVIWPLYLFQNLVKPVRNLLTKIADRVVLLFGGAPDKVVPMIMEDEFKKLIDLGRKEGVIVEEERELIHNVFEFTDKVVSDIMTPEDKIFSLSMDLPYERTVEEIKSVQYSRVPFYKGSRGNVVGILHVRDLFGLHRKRLAGEGLELKDILHVPLFVGDNTPLEALLKDFQRTQMHMAIVKDARGSLRGVVTMDDVLEELFGEME